MKRHCYRSGGSNSVWSFLRGGFLRPTAISLTLLAGVAAAQNVPGDANGDGVVAVGDIFWTINYLFASGPAPGVGKSAPAQRTGQTTCYDATNALVACPGTPVGQDGELQKGVAFPSPRFTDGGNGTVRDNLTGLTWLKNADCFGMQTWSAAMTSASALANGTCGLTDSSIAGQWRLPNVKELQSLVVYAYFAPAVPNTAGTGQWTAGNPFSSIQDNSYWTSSTVVLFPTYGWHVDLHSGSVDGDAKINPASVWPVKGGL